MKRIFRIVQVHIIHRTFREPAHRPCLQRIDSRFPPIGRDNPEFPYNEERVRLITNQWIIIVLYNELRFAQLIRHRPRKTVGIGIRIIGNRTGIQFDHIAVRCRRVTDGKVIAHAAAFAPGDAVSIRDLPVIIRLGIRNEHRWFGNDQERLRLTYIAARIRDTNPYICSSCRSRNLPIIEISRDPTINRNDRPVSLLQNNCVAVRRTHTHPGNAVDLSCCPNICFNRSQDLDTFNGKGLRNRGCNRRDRFQPCPGGWCSEQLHIPGDVAVAIL